jgi:hypothetical protein
MGILKTQMNDAKRNQKPGNVALNKSEPGSKLSLSDDDDHRHWNSMPAGTGHSERRMWPLRFASNPAFSSFCARLGASHACGKPQSKSGMRLRPQWELGHICLHHGYLTSQTLSVRHRPIQILCNDRCVTTVPHLSATNGDMLGRKHCHSFFFLAHPVEDDNYLLRYKQ